MWLTRLNTKIAADVGVSLADQFIAVAPASKAEGRQTQSLDRERGRELHVLLTGVDHDARPLQLGFFRRAKLGNSFKWRLLEHGVDPALADELTRLVLRRLADSDVPPAPEAVHPSNPESAPEPASDLSPETRPDSGSVRALLARADDCVARGAHDEVIACYQELLKSKPRHLLARNNLGVALWKLGRYHEAVEQFRRATGIQSTYADAQFNLGSLLRLTGQVAESELPLRRALKLSPKHVEAQAGLAMTLVLLGRLREAQECFEKVLKSAPGHTAAMVGLGKIASLEGRFDEAEALFRKALALDPQVPAAWAGLVDMRRMTAADGAWLKDAERVAVTTLAPLDQADLLFAIGKYCDDTGDVERAFRSYKRANELQKTTAERYDPAARERGVDNVIRVYTREAFARMSGSRSESVKPVFVVGMMRSGTSLVEQILASHPSVHGAGELPFWHEAAHRHESVLRTGLPTDQIRKKLATACLSALDAISASASHVVDKSNFNTDHLGLIHAVFPRARMVYVRRDPIDTCLSCYFNQFSSAHNFKLDLADLAHYYSEHQRMIAHWSAVLPAGTLLEVPYAELVADQEAWTRKILDVLGLEWDERCMDFHTAPRATKTASFWQVRQKIYTQSVGKWRRYEKFIGPLRKLQSAGNPGSNPVP
jgi:tetratricopeptide (TPR) repeat protein